MGAGETLRPDRPARSWWRGVEVAPVALSPRLPPYCPPCVGGAPPPKVIAPVVAGVPDFTGRMASGVVRQTEGIFVAHRFTA
jgi:hypothetical protein